jgi:hypothetical protein
MDWTLSATANALGAAWLVVAALGAMVDRARRMEKRVHNGTGLVLWGSYFVGLLALNLHTSPFGTLPAAVRYTGVAVAGASIVARLVLLGIARCPVHRAARHAGPICSAVFCTALTAASGNLIALVTVIVAASAATAVALSDA